MHLFSLINFPIPTGSILLKPLLFLLLPSILKLREVKDLMSFRTSVVSDCPNIPLQP